MIESLSWKGQEVPNVNNCFQIPLYIIEASNAEWGTSTWEAKTRRRNNLPESVVSPSLMSVDEELFSGTTWPEFVWEVQENLCIYHHITFLYGFCFPPLHYYYYFHLIKYLYREQLLIIWWESALISKLPTEKNNPGDVFPQFKIKGIKVHTPLRHSRKIYPAITQIMWTDWHPITFITFTRRYRSHAEPLCILQHIGLGNLTMIFPLKVRQGKKKKIT